MSEGERAPSRFAHEPCIGLLELSSIARGIEVSDAVLKEAWVAVLFARPFSPGKYALLVTGSVDDVRSALRRGALVAGADLLAELLLPAVDPGVLAALARPVVVPELDAVGVIETTTIEASLRGADAARKHASVELIELRLAQGIGGKSYFTLTGEVSDVEAATLAAAGALRDPAALLRRVVIPRPHPDLARLLGEHERPV